MTPSTPSSSRAVLLAFLLAAAALIGAMALLTLGQPPPVQLSILPPAPTLTALPSATPGPLTVYISGAIVGEAQVISLPPGSRVQDALAAVGGAAPDADLNVVNLAARLRDGDQVFVPRQGETRALATPPGGAVVYVNTATLAELDSLPGVGPALAERIIAFREVNGPFRSADDLGQVEGVGPSLLADIQGLVSYEE